MDFGFSEEQEMLRDAARKFCDKESPSEVVRELMEGDTGYSPEMWANMAELGWMALPFPEEYGGLDLGFVDLTVVLEEMGRALLPGPFISTVVLAGYTILMAGNDDQKKELLSKISEGEAIMTLALAEPAGTFEADGVSTTATAKGDSYVINGTKLFVPDAHVANQIICVARTKDTDDKEDGITLFVVDAEAEGVTRSLLKTMDMVRKQCEVVFDNVKVPKENILGKVDKGWPIIKRALDKANTALCAEMVGGAQKVLELSVEYAKERVQFGRPIGSFQAIKHKCSDMMLEVESAKSITYYAAWAVDEEVPEASLAASMAKAYTSDAFAKATGEGIQILGGTGFTWEHDMHLYFKRARSSQFSYGDATYHREQVAQLIDL